MLLDLSYLFGLAIGRSLLRSPEEEAAREAEAQREFEETRLRLKAAEEERKARFEADKSVLLEQFKGRVPAENVEWKGMAFLEQDLTFKFDEYRKRETERREVFERTTDVWCKLNAPLYPMRPIMPIPEDQYEQMMAYYKARKAEWDDRCKEIQSEAASQPLTWKETTEPKQPAKAKPVPLPIACSDCWSNFDRASGGCATLNTNMERLVCVNSALDDWVWCIGGCRTEPNEPVKIQK